MLAQLSDPHIGGSPGAEQALAAAVAAVAALDPAPDAVLVSGDVADTPTRGEYARARELLAPLAMPVHVLPGNHDDPAALGAVFGAAPPFATTAGPLRLICLDSTLAGAPGGALGPERLDWLDDALAADARTPTIVALHHPPVPTAMPGMDAIGISAEDRAALAAVLTRHPHARRIVAGHAHRAMTGALGGCSVMVCPSVHLQLRLDLTTTRLEVGHDPPGYGLHVAVDGEIASHVLTVRS